MDTITFDEAKDFLESTKELVDEANAMALFSLGLSTCLVCYLGSAENIPGDIVSSIDDDVRTEALKIAEKEIKYEEDYSEDSDPNGSNTILDATPEKIWVFHVTPAIIKKHGFSERVLLGKLNANIEDIEIPNGLLEIKSYYQVAEDILESLDSYVDKAAEFISKSMGFAEPLPPSVVMYAVELAQQDGVKLDNRFSKWFPEYLDKAIIELNKGRAEQNLPPMFGMRPN